MEEVAALKQKAARIRRLARGSGNDLTAEMLIALARETEAKAIDAEQKNQAADTKPSE